MGKLKGWKTIIGAVCGIILAVLFFVFQVVVPGNENLTADQYVAMVVAGLTVLFGATGIGGKAINGELPNQAVGSDTGDGDNEVAG